jgi:signal transduction histidine kinase
VTSDKGHCRIVVADNGDGVATTDLDRIAQRFVRLDSSRSAPGNGLGLSLVRAVVDQHRGRLVFEDNKPGLRVILELPRREPESK